MQSERNDGICLKSQTVDFKCILDSAGNYMTSESNRKNLLSSNRNLSDVNSDSLMFNEIRCDIVEDQASDLNSAFRDNLSKPTSTRNNFISPGKKFLNFETEKKMGDACPVEASKKIGSTI